MASTRNQRAPLTRERVLRAAAQVADGGGFDALTMRSLASRLDVQAMSLYNYVRSKADLRDGIVELVLTEVELANPGEDWKASVRASAISAYTVLRRHPWASRQMMATTTMSMAHARWMDALLRTLREAGCSPTLAHRAYHALDAHITGFSLWEANFAFEDEADVIRAAQTFLAEHHDTLPYLVEHAHQHLAPADPGGPSDFEFGLDLILDGIDRLRAAEA